MSLDVPSTAESSQMEDSGDRVTALGRLIRIFLSLADQATISGVRFVSAMLIATAGPSVLGIYQMSFGLLLIAVCIQESLICAPFNLYHARLEGEGKRKYHGSILVQVAVLAVCSSVFFTFAWWVGQRLGISVGLASAFGALAIATPFVLLREFARRVELARLRTSSAFLVDAASGFLQIVFLWGLVQYGMLKIEGVYFATALSCGIAALVWLTFRYRGNEFNKRSVTDEMKRHWAVGRWPFFAQVVGVLHVQSVVWLLGWRLGEEAAGLFTACNYVIFFVNPVALGVCNSLSPLAVHTYRNTGTSAVKLLISIAMAGMGISVALFALTAYWYSDAILITIWKLPVYLGLGNLMLLLGVNMALSVMHMMNDQGVWAIERPKWLLRSTLMTVCLTVVCAIPMIEKWGLSGAALSLIVGRIVGLVYQTVMFYSESNKGPSDIKKESTKVTKITVVTPTLNAAKYLTTCLDSVRQQATDRVEVQHLILDGGSSDGTLDLTHGYSVTLVPRNRDMKLVDAICLGFDVADGDLIVFLGADDLFFPGALDAVARVYEQEKRDLLFCRTRWVDANLRSLGELAPTPRWMTAPAHASLGWCYMAASATFISRRLYRDLGGFDRTFTKSSDYEFYTRMLKIGVPYSTIDQAVSMYRRHDDNESLLQDSSYWQDCRRVREMYAPKNSMLSALLSCILKGWIYVRNPMWSYSQLARKIRSGTFRG